MVQLHTVNILQCEVKLSLKMIFKWFIFVCTQEYLILIKILYVLTHCILLISDCKNHTDPDLKRTELKTIMKKRTS